MTVRRVLVVDDDAPLRRVLCRELSRRFDTVGVASFDEAMAILDAGPELFAVVSDHDLGGRRWGHELLAEVAQRWPACVRLLMSGRATAEAAAPGCLFVLKPWEPGSILATLEEAAAP